MSGQFTKLVLSGGGPRGLAIIGALHYAHEKNMLNNINEYYGTSIGSVISLLLLIGYTPVEAFQQFFMIDQIVSPLETFELKDIIEQSAFCPIEVLDTRFGGSLKASWVQMRTPHLPSYTKDLAKSCMYMAQIQLQCAGNVSMLIIVQI